MDTSTAHSASLGRLRLPANWRLHTATLVMSLLAACVAPGTGETPLPPLSLPSACGGTAPSCVTSCQEREALATATCEEGVYRCEVGAREDLCCDPVDNPERCPEWGAVCREDAPCAEGYTCVTSRSWPMPDLEGVCRLGDWTIPPELSRCEPLDVTTAAVIPSMGQSPLKIEGVVQVVPSCDDRRCTADNPCCQRCIGSYRLDMIERNLALRVGLRTETLSCVGTNCGFSCAPLQPGRRYRLWGMWMPDDGATAPGTLFVAGSCPL